MRRLAVAVSVALGAVGGCATEGPVAPAVDQRSTTVAFPPREVTVRFPTLPECEDAERLPRHVRLMAGDGETIEWKAVDGRGEAQLRLLPGKWKVQGLRCRSERPPVGTGLPPKQALAADCAEPFFDEEIELGASTKVQAVEVPAPQWLTCRTEPEPAQQQARGLVIRTRPGCEEGERLSRSIRWVLSGPEGRLWDALTGGPMRLPELSSPHEQRLEARLCPSPHAPLLECDQAFFETTVALDAEGEGPVTVEVPLPEGVSCITPPAEPAAEVQPQADPAAEEQPAEGGQQSPDEQPETQTPNPAAP